MTVLFKISLHVAAIAVILVAAGAGEDSATASEPSLPQIGFEVGATRVQHQKVVIKDTLRGGRSLRWHAVDPATQDGALIELFRMDGGVVAGPFPDPILPADPGLTGGPERRATPGHLPATSGPADLPHAG